jgi:hypothetical protein
VYIVRVCIFSQHQETSLSLIPWGDSLDLLARRSLDYTCIQRHTQDPKNNKLGPHKPCTMFRPCHIQLT